MPIPIPASLVRYLKEGRCVLFVGAGLSAAAGLPDWKRLLLAMVSDIENEGATDGVGAELRKMIDAGKLLEVADHCRQRLGEQRYLQLLGDQLRGGAGELPDTHRFITQLPFSAIVTTNYDKLLERAYTRFRGDLPKVVTSRARESLGSLLFSGGFFILKAHGDIDDAASLVLTARDYREIIHANPAFDALFSALLMTRSVLFVGYSLGDPDFRLLLDRQLSTFGENIPERYAVMCGVGPVESDVMKRSANIRLLSYPDGRHEELLIFLRALAERLQPEAAAGSMPVRVAPPAPPPYMPAQSTQAASPPPPAPAVVTRATRGARRPAASGAGVGPAPAGSPAPVPAAVSQQTSEAGRETATVVPPIATVGAQMLLLLRDNRLRCMLTTATGMSIHDTEPTSWSLFHRRLATLLQDREHSRLVENYQRIGRRLADLLPRDEIAAIPAGSVVQLVTQGELAEIPWELATCEGTVPLAITHRTIRAAGEAAFERGLPGIRQPARVLVIGDPGTRPMVGTRLPGAEAEAREIHDMYTTAGHASRLLSRGGAELDAVTDALTAGAYDVIHFAGHAWFDRYESYLAFGEADVLTASELRSLLGARPPAILVLNSHYTAFLPRGTRPADLATQAAATELPPSSNIGFMSMAMAAGIGVFLGTFESPMDLPAQRFGAGVHRALLEGAAIVDAVHRARRALLAAEPDDVTTLQYVLSGHPEYRLTANP